jgi:cytochrome c oxidase cbb3-type subunit 3
MKNIAGTIYPFVFIFVLAASTLTQSAFAAPDGKSLYLRHCAACHGSDGNGGVGLPLALPSFLKIVPKSYIAKTIKLGRPGRVMPSFNQLADNEINAIAEYILSWQKGEHLVLSRSEVKGDKYNGEKLFKQNCKKCHGQNGEGGAGTGVTFSRPRFLPIIPPALNNPGFLAAAPDQFIKMTLIKGRDKTPMVSFVKKGLSEQQINDIVTYVRSFQDRRQNSDASVEGNQPATISYVSSSNFKDTIENVKQAIVNANFVLIRMQDLDSGLVPAADADPDKVVIYFCNFHLIDKFLKIDPRIGVFLPCRVTVTRQNGRVRLQTVNPKILSGLFNNDELQKACDEMTKMYRDVMEDSI